MGITNLFVVLNLVRLFFLRLTLEVRDKYCINLKIAGDVYQMKRGDEREIQAMEVQNTSNINDTLLSSTFKRSRHVIRGLFILQFLFYSIWQRSSGSNL